MNTITCKCGATSATSIVFEPHASTTRTCARQHARARARECVARMRTHATQLYPVPVPVPHAYSSSTPRYPSTPPPPYAHSFLLLYTSVPIPYPSPLPPMRTASAGYYFMQYSTFAALAKKVGTKVRAWTVAKANTYMECTVTTAVMCPLPGATTRIGGRPGRARQQASHAGVTTPFKTLFGASQSGALYPQAVAGPTTQSTQAVTTPYSRRCVYGLF